MQPLFHPSFGKISYLVQSDAALKSFSLKNPHDYGSATNWNFNQWWISTISSFSSVNLVFSMQMEQFLYLYNVLQNIFVFLDFLVDYSILCFSEYLMTNFFVLWQFMCILDAGYYVTLNSFHWTEDLVNIIVY